MTPTSRACWSTPSARAGGDAHADIQSVRRALAAIPPTQREVVVLRYYLQLSERETADALKIPPGTVKSRMSAALKHLATALEPTHGDS